MRLPDATFEYPARAGDKRDQRATFGLLLADSAFMVGYVGDREAQQIDPAQHDVHGGGEELHIP